MFSHSSNCSGGVAICFSRCPGKEVTYKADDFDYWLAVVLNIDGTFVIQINVYGLNKSNQNKLLLSEVITGYKEKYHTEFVLTGGDLNVTPDGILLVFFKLQQFNRYLGDTNP